jgi:flagellar M-ring protein FliF
LLVLAAVVLVLAIFVLRPMLRSPRPGDEAAPQIAPGMALAGPAPFAAGPRGEEPVGPALTGEIDDTPGPAGGVGGDEGAAVDPVARMRQLIAERQDETLEILRHWMEEPEEPR